MSRKNTNQYDPEKDNPSGEYCSTCQTLYFDPANKLCIQNTTECLKCDHIRIDHDQE